MRSLFLSAALTALIVTPVAAQDSVASSSWPEGWYLLDTALIDGETDRESALNYTSSGKRAEAIAFRAVDGDLQCEQISVSFADGHSRFVEANPGNVFLKGEMHIVDLEEGSDAEITRINFTCNAVAGTQVLIEVGASG